MVVRAIPCTFAIRLSSLVPNLKVSTESVNGPSQSYESNIIKAKIKPEIFLLTFLHTPH